MAMITRLIVIDIALLMVLFCNCPLFCNYPLVICYCPLLKDIVFVGLVSLNSNHIFGLGDFWNKSPT